jgi:sec-independent protein translocase protein TatA
MWEILLIFMVVLLLFGAKRLPEIGSSLGKGIREFKGSLREIEGELKTPPEQKKPQLSEPKVESASEPQPKEGESGGPAHDEPVEPSGRHGALTRARAPAGSIPGGEGVLTLEFLLFLGGAEVRVATVDDPRRLA